MSSSTTNEDDITQLLLIVMGGIALGGGSIAGVLFSPIRTWLIEYHLLAHGEEVVLPFVDGVGLGWLQIIVLIGLLVALVAITVSWRRRRAARI